MKALRLVLIVVGCVVIAACGEGNDSFTPTRPYNPPPELAPNAAISQFELVSSNPRRSFPDDLLFENSRDFKPLAA